MVYLVGASGHGLVVKDILNLRNIRVYKFVDINSSLMYCDGIEVVNPNSLEIQAHHNFLISIGDNHLRKKNALSFASAKFMNAIHPSSIISKSVELGKGVVIGANAVVNTKTVIGNHVILNSCSCVDHESIIGDYSHISPGATLCGNVTVGEGTHVGSGATIIPNLNIGKWSVIAAGAVVVNDVPDYVMVAGVPAKIIRNLQNA